MKWPREIGFRKFLSFLYPQQDFEAVPYDSASFGKFHTGDSYIVLKVRLPTSSTNIIVM